LPHDCGKPAAELCRELGFRIRCLLRRARLLRGLGTGASLRLVRNDRAHNRSPGRGLCF